MITEVMQVFSLLVVTLMFWLTTHYFWRDPLAGHRSRQDLNAWIARGLACPLAIWLILNLNLFSACMPLSPSAFQTLVTHPRYGSLSWFERSLLLLPACAYSCLTIGAVWFLISLGEVLECVYRVCEDRKELKRLWFFCSIFFLPLLFIIVLVFRWAGLWAGLVAWLMPTAFFSTYLLQAKHPSKPLYARALARIQFGKYEESELEILKQLEQAPDDYEGWMLLAELLALRFQDVDGAKDTILQLCSQPNINETQISLAYNRLADWHLKIEKNLEGARAAYEAICSRLAGTHFDRMARLQIKRLPTETELLESDQPKTIALAGTAAGDSTGETFTQLSSDDQYGQKQLDKCIDHLRRYPQDIGMREKLASVYAEQFGRIDLAEEQINRLIKIAGDGEAKQVEWLNQMATWFWQINRDEAAARRILEQIIALFPETPYAYMARRRQLTLGSAQK